MHNLLPKKYYFIDKFDKNSINKQDKETAIIYRNYSIKVKKSLILQIKKYCRKKGNKFFLSNNIRLAINLGLDGAYLPSFYIDQKHINFTIKKKFFIIGSAHNIKEIRTKEKQKVNAIFISSLFKKNKNYLGINRFRLISNLTKKKIIALGGISANNTKQLKLIKCYGFSGISFFK